MRRLLLVGAALSILATVTMTGVTGASTAQSRHLVPAARSHIAGAISVGSTWTYYDWDGLNGGFSGACEEFTFSGGHVFTGDKGDSGKWSGNIKLKFAGTAGYFAGGPGATYTGKYLKSVAAFSGLTTLQGAAVDAAYLYPGSDPEGLGTC